MNKKTEDENNSETAIPSILTVSAKTLMKFYKEQIVELFAEGGTYGTNKTILDDDYGIYLNNPGETRIGMHYKQKRDEDTGNILNPLNKNKVEDVCNLIDERLPRYYDEKEDKYYPADLSVEKIVIEIKDDKLQKLSHANSNVFDLMFISEVVETPELREKTQSKNKEMGLVQYQGFKIRNLNLHELIETIEKYGQTKPSYIQQWNGLNDIQPKSPLKIAQRVYNHYLPENFAELNFIQIKGTNRVVLTPIAR